MGPALVHDPPFSAFRRHSYTRFSNSPRNNTGVVFFPWFLPDWCTIHMSWVLSRRTLFCVVCLGCHALHEPSPHGFGCSCAFAYVSFVIRVLASYSSGHTLALQSLTLPTWRPYFRVQRLFKTPPSGVLIVSACKTGVVLPCSYLFGWLAVRASPGPTSVYDPALLLSFSFLFLSFSFLFFGLLIDWTSPGSTLVNDPLFG